MYVGRIIDKQESVEKTYSYIQARAIEILSINNRNSK